MFQDGGAVPGHPVGLNQVSGTVKPALVLGRPGEELEDGSRNAEQPLSSNMTLLWSDEDEDLTVPSPLRTPLLPEHSSALISSTSPSQQVDSPSPVFPEEQPASLDPPGGSPGPSASTRRFRTVTREATFRLLPPLIGLIVLLLAESRRPGGRKQPAAPRCTTTGGFRSVREACTPTATHG